MKSRGRGNPRTSLIFGGPHVTISDCDLEERTAGESQACPAPSPIPMTPLSSLLLLGNVFTFPRPAPLASSPLRVTSGSCWGHCVSASLWAVSSPPRYFSHSLSGLGARTPGFPAYLLVQGCPAGLQRVAKLVSFLLRGEGLLPGLGGIKNPRWAGVGAPQHPGSSLLASDSAGGQHMPCLAGTAGSRLQASISACGQPRSSALLFSFFSPMVSGGGH